MSLEVRIAHQFRGFLLDVDFAVETPGVTALFGPSGSGKTTTINAVAGLFRPRTGRIVAQGDVLLDTDEGIDIPTRLRNVGYVFQDSRLFPHLDARANLVFGWRRARPRPAQRELDRVIDLLGVADLLHRLPRTLSGGEKQRIALGRALLSSPRLLLMDEPLAALGQSMKQEILPYLERLRDESKIPMIYVSHSVEEVARLADDVIILEGGRVAAQGSVFDLFSSLSPETRELSVGAVIETRVVRHLPDDHLSELALGEARLIVPLVPAPERAIVRLRINARDITIALDAPGRISANNVLPAVVGGVRASGDGQADIQLLCGPAKLLAQITEYSRRRLALATGMRVYAIIKSVTVDRPGRGTLPTISA